MKLSTLALLASLAAPATALADGSFLDQAKKTVEADAKKEVKKEEDKVKADAKAKAKAKEDEEKKKVEDSAKAKLKKVVPGIKL
jgi:hypothetical protein